MTNILELLKNEKVEWKKLGEVCEIIAGGDAPRLNMSKSKDENYKIPIVSNGIGENSIYGWTNIEKISKPSITISARGTIGWTNLILEPFYPVVRLLVLTPKIKVNIKYIYYIMKNKENTYILPKTGIQQLTKPMIIDVEIPIPSLETQEKIVEILDKFTNCVTELQLELQSELQSRTKQYTYYRDKLLSEEYLTKVTKEMEEDKRLNIVQLEEVVTIKNGKDWKKLGQGNIPVYGSGGEMGVFVDKYSYDKPTVLIPRKGSIDNVFYLDKPFWNVDTIFYTKIDESKLKPKYFYYFIEHYDLNKLSDNSTRPSLTQSNLNKLKLPLPPLSLQNKIVKVLDKFQVLLADTKGLLPAEIEERQKQYEYYREKLLTFDEVSDRFDSIRFITSLYYDILQEAANIVGVDIQDEVEIINLGEISNINRGASPRPIKSFISNEIENSVPWIKIGDTKPESKYIVDTKERITKEGAKKSRVLKKGSFILSNSMSYGRPYILSIDGAIHDGWASINDFEQFLVSDYLYHYLITKRTQDYWQLKMNTASVSNLNSEIIRGLSILVPPLHVQQQVVSILDKFDTLVNDIKEGLPKEIEQRQKQYEYWRECLLNFPR